MNITVLSCFRQATHYIERYCEQMDGLQAALRRRGDTLKLVLGYGDSDDGTGAALFDECSNRFCAHLIDCSHGGPVFGSIEHPQRFKQLAYVGNRLLDAVPDDSDVVGIVESDLIWEAETLWSLALWANVWGGAIAPMVMDSPPKETFYDVFAFRRYGQRFTKEPPYAPVARSGHMFSTATPLDSAGSVLFMPAHLARVARFTEDEAIVGLCKDIYAHDGSVWLNSRATVYHP